MLTSEHVRVYRRGDQLHLRSIDKNTLFRASEYAEHFLAVLRSATGKDRSVVLAELASFDVESKDRDLAEGLKKLALDRAEFEEMSPIPPVELRRFVFELSAQERYDAKFDRAAVLSVAAAHFESDPETIEKLLFSDLRDEQQLMRFADCEAHHLLTAYDLGQVQGVLLRAESIVVHVSNGDGAGYRHLFRSLKFHRLMHTISKTDSGYRIELTGPLSLFGGTTKYGLAMALVVPAIRAAGDWRIEAVVRWGKERRRLHFGADGKRSGTRPVVDLSENEQLLAKLQKELPDWKVDHAEAIFSVPGLGEFIPDFSVEHLGRRVFIEMLGHWSTEAVWKRIDLLERGLPVRALLCASSRLRITEDALPATLPSALYLYKGVPSAKAIAKHCSELAGP